MNSHATLSLLQIEQEIETQAKEWQRQRLQQRLQQQADEQGAVCPETGEALQEARYETVTLDTCAGTLTIQRIMGGILGPGNGSIRSGCFGGSNRAKGSVRSCRSG
jgi:hypothetical protein